MKSKGHIYMANLLIEELKNHGCFFIKENDKYNRYNVPDIIKESILTYPSYFRGGSIGPDFFPDLIFGQMIIHPEHSGEWLNIMFNELCAMPLNHEDTKKAWAFYMGYLVHYAGDMFTHRYVNSYAKGWFPSIKGILDNFLNDNGERALLDCLIIIRHMAIEAYMDERIELGLKSINKKAWITHEYAINVPIDYLKSCFATKHAVNRADFITNTRFKDFELTDFNFIKAYVNYLEKYRSEATKNYYKNLVDNGTLTDEDFENCSNKVKKDIIEIEKMIDSWLKLWEKIAQKALYSGTKTAISEAEEDLFIFVPEYALRDTEYYDIYNIIKKIVDFFNNLGINIPIIDYILDYIEEEIKDELKEYAFPYIKDLANIVAGPEKNRVIEDFDEAMDTIKGVIKDPIHLINNPLLFNGFSLSEKLKDEWDNLGKTTDANDITFLPFYQGLVMSKLCLIGTDELNGICKRFDQEPVFTKAKFTSSLQQIKIVTTTSSMAYADTNKDVYFKIVLDNNPTIVLPLVNNYRNNFKKGKQDVFELVLPYTVHIDHIVRFEVELSGNNNWIFNNFTVLDSRTGIILGKLGHTKLEFKKPAGIQLFKNINKDYESNKSINSITNLSITITTDDVLYSGTDDDVKISINYANGTSYSKVLDKYMYNDFERDDLDTYTLALPSPVELSELKSFTISKNGSDDWKLKYIVIYDTDTGLCLCRANVKKWVNSTGYTYPLFNINNIESANTISSNAYIKNLLVTIKTDTEDYSGTNNNIFVDIEYIDDSGKPQSEKYYIDKAFSDNFEAGDLDTFIIKMKEPIRKKRIRSFKLYCTGEDQWKVKFFAIHDLDTLYHFGTVHGNWIRTENDFIKIFVSNNK